MLPNSPNVILAAQEAAKLSEKPRSRRRLPLPAGGAGGAGRARPRAGCDRQRRAARLGARRDPLGAGRAGRARRPRGPRSCAATRSGSPARRSSPGEGRLDALRDDRADRRGGRDRHRDRGRRRPDPARPAAARARRGGRAGAPPRRPAALLVADRRAVRRGSVSVMSKPILWHIEISHYNEKARWALDHKGVEHERRAPHAGGAHGRRAVADPRPLQDLPGAPARRPGDRRLDGDHRGARASASPTRRCIRTIRASAAGRWSSRSSSTRSWDLTLACSPSTRPRRTRRSSSASRSTCCLAAWPTSGLSARGRRASSQPSPPFATA